MITHYMNGSSSGAWLREMLAIQREEVLCVGPVQVPPAGMRMVGICRTCGADVPIAEFSSEQGCARCGGV